MGGKDRFSSGPPAFPFMRGDGAVGERIFEIAEGGGAAGGFEIADGEISWIVECELSEGRAAEDTHGAEVGVVERIVLIEEGHEINREGAGAIGEGKRVSEGVIGIETDGDAAHAVEGEEAGAEVDAAGDEVHAVGEGSSVVEAAGGGDAGGEGIIGMCSGECHKEIRTEGGIVREQGERLLSSGEQGMGNVLLVECFEECGEECFSAVMFTGFDKPGGDAEEIVELARSGGECVNPALFELCEGAFVGELHEGFLIHGVGVCV